MSESQSDRALLHECAQALENLLSCPDLHLEGLEETILQAIEQAYSVHQKISERLAQVYCVLCGELLPNESFTEADRGQLIAYAHRACAERAAQSAPPEQS
jgi:hypothetical protein